MDNNKLDNNKKVIILLNDSDPLMSLVCRNKFKKENGWDSIVTRDFDEALEETRAQKPSVVLTEIILNNFDKTGFDLIKEIRASEDLSGTKIAIFTDLNKDEDRQKAKEIGADGYFVKHQMTIKTLIDKIADLI